MPGRPFAEWGAFFEYIDLAAAHWDARVLAWLRERHPPRRGRAVMKQRDQLGNRMTHAATTLIRAARRLRGFCLITMSIS